jgi:hypothetical protein
MRTQDRGHLWQAGEGAVLNELEYFETDAGPGAHSLEEDVSQF